jgi:Raf kinase inhibitor-like YbhB/YbcL family protein
VTRLAAALMLAVLLSACAAVITPTTSPGPPSPTEPANIEPSEAPFVTQSSEATIVPNATPLNTSDGETQPPGEPTATAPLETLGDLPSLLQSSAFRAISGSPHIPPRYTCDGIDVSPPLEWHIHGNPEISELAIVVRDPDAGGFTHWVVARIPGTDAGLDEGAGDPNAGNGLLQGKNSFGSIGWRGPCPPAGRTHHYHFALYAFASAPDLSDAPTADEVAHAGGTLAAEFDALYGH